jgi:hypothetical protein
MRPRLAEGSIPSNNRRMMMTLWKLSHRLARKNSTPKLNKIEANNSVKTPDLNNKTITTSTTSIDGGITIQAIALMATR